MLVLAMTDIHGRAGFTESFLEDLSHAEIVLLCGDLTHFGGKQEVENLLSGTPLKDSFVLAVHGNCDLPGAESYLYDRGISLHGRYREIDGIGFFGLGGSIPCPGKTPCEYSEDQIWQILNEGYPENLRSQQFVLVSHQPPWNTKNDAIAGDHHVGSTSVRRFIEETKPAICFTGHIHEGIGMDRIGDTHIVNPGPFMKGGYALAELREGRVEGVSIRKINGGSKPV